MIDERDFDEMMLDVLLFAELVQSLGYNRMDIIRSLSEPNIHWVDGNAYICRKLSNMKKTIIKECYEELKVKYIKRKDDE